MAAGKRHRVGHQRVPVDQPVSLVYNQALKSFLWQEACTAAGGGISVETGIVLTIA